MELTEFLLARIGEDEDRAKRAAFGWGATWSVVTDEFEDWSTVHADGKRDMVGCEDGDVTEHIARHDPARVLAECQAKRRIAGLHHREIWHQPASTINDPKTGRPFVEESDHLGGCTICAGDSSYADWPCDTLKALTAIYADHPDCDPGWKP